MNQSSPPRMKIAELFSAEYRLLRELPYLPLLASWYDLRLLRLITQELRPACFWDRQGGLHNPGVKLCPGRSAQGVQGFSQPAGRAGRPGVDQGIQGVGHGEDPGGERDLLAA